MNTHKIISELLHIQKLLNHTPLLSPQKTELKKSYLSMVTLLSSDKQKQCLHLIISALSLSAHPTENLFILLGAQGTTDTKPLKESTPSTSSALLALANLAYTFEQNGAAQDHAHQLSVMCGDLENSLIYLHGFSLKHRTSPHIVHDACLYVLPEAHSRWDISAWRKLVNNNGKWKNLIENKDVREYILPSADKLEASLKQAAYLEQTRLSQNAGTELSFPWDTAGMHAEQQKPLQRAWKIFVKHPGSPDAFQAFLLKCPISLLKNEYDKLSYIGCEKNPEAAKEFKKHGLTQEDFDLYLTLKPQDSDEIPDVRITGADLGLSRCNYHLRKLDPRDPKAAFAGKMTDCCQSLGGAGEACAIYGITSPHSGFYVICKGQGHASDPIVSQTWVWRSQTGALVLDSIEFLSKNAEGEIKDTQFKNIDLWIALYRELARVLVTKHGISKVMTGCGGKTPQSIGVSGTHYLKAETPIDYEQCHPDDHYRDSEDQMMLATDKIPLSALYILNNEGHDFPGGVQAKTRAKNELTGYLCYPYALKQFIDFIYHCTPAMPAFNLLYTFDVFLGAELKILFHKYYDHQFNIEAKNKWLAKATEEGTLQHVQWLIGHGSDSHAKKNGGPLLDIAAQNGHLDKVQYFLQKGPDDNLKNAARGTLHVAVLAKQLNVVQFLLAQKADINIANHCGDSTLHLAVLSGELAMVQYVLQYPIADVQTQNAKGHTTLHTAAQCGQLDIVRCLVEHKVNLNTHDEKSNTVLHLGIPGPLDIFHFLVEAKANVNTRNDDGHTPLLKAAQYHLWATVQYLIENNAHINIQDAYGNTALHEAAAAGELTTLQYLLQNKADIDIQNHDGFTPLTRAATIGQWNTLQCLVEHLPPVGKQDSKLSHVLWRSAQASEWKIVKSLVEKNADVNAIPDQYYDPLIQMVAAQADNLDILQFLIEQKADLNIKAPNTHHTALRRAAQRRKWDTVEYLLAHKALVNINPQDNIVILRIALRAAKGDIIQYLIEQGISFDPQTEDGIRILEAAKGHQAFNPVAFLENWNTLKDSHLKAGDLKLKQTEIKTEAETKLNVEYHLCYGVDTYLELGKRVKTLTLSPAARKVFHETCAPVIELLKKEPENPLLEEGFISPDHKRRDRQGEYYITLEVAKKWLDAVMNPKLKAKKLAHMVYAGHEAEVPHLLKQAQENTELKTFTIIAVLGIHAVSIFVDCTNNLSFILDSEPGTDLNDLLEVCGSLAPRMRIIRSSPHLRLQKDYYSCMTFALKSARYYAQCADDFSKLLMRNKTNILEITDMPAALLKMAQMPLSLREQQNNTVVSKKNNLTLLQHYALYKWIKDGTTLNTAALKTRQHILKQLAAALQKDKEPQPADSCVRIHTPGITRMHVL